MSGGPREASPEPWPNRAEPASGAVQQVFGMRRGPREPWSLVGLSIGVQWLGSRLGGSAVAAFFAALVVWRAQAPFPGAVGGVPLGGYVYALWAAIQRRRRPEPGAALARLDFELVSLATVGVVEGVWWAQASVRGPYWGFAYVGFALACAFARPLASWGSWIVLAG